MSGVAVRAATAADAVGLAALGRAAWYAAYGGHLPEAAIESALTHWHPDAWLARIVAPSHLVLVATERRTGLIGAAHAWAEPDEPDAWFLDRLYTDPTRTGEGIGTALLDEVSTALPRGTRWLDLDYFAFNTRAATYYERHGFRPLRSATFPWDGVDHEMVIVRRPHPWPAP